MYFFKIPDSSLKSACTHAGVNFKQSDWTYSWRLFTNISNSTNDDYCRLISHFVTSAVLTKQMISFFSKYVI